jgi:hypothetical protein
MDLDRQFGFKPERPLLVFYDDLLKVYEHKACEKLMEWSSNVIKADRDSKPDIDPRDGLLYTEAPLELMRMITQQVQRGVAPSAQKTLSNSKITNDDIRNRWRRSSSSTTASWSAGYGRSGYLFFGTMQ